MARFAYGNVLNSALRLPRSNGFSPSALFAASEPGAWYDPSDLSTMFQDSAGTTPVTATGQTVGLVLDKSKGLVLGPELVTNGDFSQGATGWDSSNATLSVVSGALRIASQTASPATTTQAINGLVIGRTYVFTATYWQGGTGGTAARVSFAGITSQNNSTSTPLTVRFMAVAAASFATIGLQSFGTSATESYFDNISVKELPGNHATQATAASRPIYGIEPFGGRRNLLTWTEDLTNAVWSANAATKNTAIKFTATALNNAHAVVQSFAHTTGVTYTYQQVLTYDNNRFVSLRLLVGVFPHVCFDLVNGTIAGSETGATGTITSLGGGSYLCTITVTATSTSTGNAGVFILPNATNYGSAWLANGTEAVTMTNAQLETGSTATAYQRVIDQWNVTQAGVPSVAYVAFDGTDDFLVTPTITPGIDKAQVFAGVRKLSDAAQGIVVESSTSSLANSGAFMLRAPAGANATYGWFSWGAAGVGGTATTSASYTSPITNVLTGLGDIAGDVATIRVNGTQVATGATDQGTGNYLAYPLYVGRRGGTSLPFNGRMYGLITRFGANLSEAQITQTETWMNSKTGAF